MNGSWFFLIPNIIVFSSWIIFWIGFFSHRRQGKQEEKRRDPGSIAGIIIEGIGFAIMFTFHRDFAALDTGLKIIPRIALISFASILAPFSTWIALAAIRTLGKQWSLTARTLVNHELITAGPYRYVRHPIYSSMFGLLLATGILITHPLALIAAIIIFVFGTQLRINAEERLLIDQFGPSYQEYRKRVKAIIPFLW